MAPGFTSIAAGSAEVVNVLVPVWRSKKLAELIPGAKLTVIPGAPHGANLERSDEFNDAVLGFIEEHDRGLPRRP